MAIKVFHVDHDFQSIPLVQGGAAKVIVWPGTGARLGSLNYCPYLPGQSSVVHAHPKSEDIFYIIEGDGEMVEYCEGVEISRQPIRPGSVVQVEPGTEHQVHAFTRLVNVGGPCPPDLDFYKRFGLKW